MVRQRQSVWVQGSDQLIGSPTRKNKRCESGANKCKEMCKRDVQKRVQLKTKEGCKSLSQMCEKVLEKFLHQVMFLVFVVFMVAGGIHVFP